MLVTKGHQLAARERTEPTTAANAQARLRELQDLLGAMRFSGSFTGLEQICPPTSLASMMRDQAAGRFDALPPLLSPCLTALGTLGRLPDTTAAAPAPGPLPGPPAGPLAGPSAGSLAGSPAGSLAGPSAVTSARPLPGLAGGAPGPAALAAPGPTPAVVAPQASVAVTVELPTTAGQLTVSPAVPSGMHDQAPQFSAQTVTPRNGRLRLTLSDTPVYIEEHPRETPPTPAERLASPFGAHPATYRGENPPFALAHDLGIGWHRGVAWWVDIQSDADLAAGKFDFSRLDAQLAAMGPDMRAVLTIMLPARLRQDTADAPPGAGGPGMPGAPGQPGPLAVKTDGSWELGPPVTAFDAFVRALVTRYGLRPPAGISRVAYWQFENELDLSRARNDAAGFAALLTRTSRLIKSVDPKATVLAAGVSGEDFARNFAAYYLPLLQNLKGRGFDVFDLHSFGRAGDYKELAAMTATARRALDANGFSRAPIWMTETATYSGAPALPPGLPPQSEADQAAELVRRGVYALSLGVKKVFWAMVREGFHFRNGLFDHVGLTCDPRVSPDKPDGAPKLAYFTYRRLCAKLAGCNPMPERLALGPNVYAYRFRAAKGRTVTVAWADPGPQPGDAPR